MEANSKKASPRDSRSLNRDRRFVFYCQFINSRATWNISGHIKWDFMSYSVRFTFILVQPGVGKLSNSVNLM